MMPRAIPFRRISSWRQGTGSALPRPPGEAPLGLQILARLGWFLALTACTVALADALATVYVPGAVVVLPVFMALGVLRPRWALLLLVATAPLLNILYRGGSLYVSSPIFEVLLLSLYLPWLGRLALGWGRGSPPRPGESGDEGLATAFLLLTTVAAGHALAIGAGVPGYFRWPPDLYVNGGQMSFAATGPLAAEALRPLLTLLESVLGFFFVRREMKGLERGRSLARAVTISLAATGALGIADYLTVDRASLYQGTNRAIGAFSGPNLFATFLLLTLPLAAAIMVMDRWSWRVVGLVGGGLGLMNLCLTRSAGGWVGAVAATVVAVAIAAARSRRGRRRAVEGRRCPRRTWLMAGLAAMIAIFAAVAWLHADTSAEGLNELSGRRYYLWVAGLSMVVQHPVMGVGLGDFFRDLPAYYPPWVTPREWHEHAHNLYLQMAAEEGLIAFGLFGAMIWRIVSRATRRLASAVSPLRVATLAALTGVLVHSLFDATLLAIPLSWLFWVLLGLLASVPDRPEGDLEITPAPGGSAS